MSSLEALSRRVRQSMARTHLHPLATSGAVPGGTAPRPWAGKDGLRIPRAADARRLDWELRFLQLLLEVYGLSAHQAQVVRVPAALEAVEHANGVKSPSRYALYRRMLAAGEPVPPILVEHRGDRWFIWDGNHRTHAARDAGVPFLVGIARRTAAGPAFRQAKSGATLREKP